MSAVALSPDGKMVVTETGNGAGVHGVAQRWDCATGRPIGPHLPQPGYVLAVAFSPDGSRLLTGTGYLYQTKGEAQLRDAKTGKPLGAPLPHENDVRAVGFSPDGKILLTGSQDGTARRWDAENGQPMGPPIVHAGPVACVAYSRDGSAVDSLQKRPIYCRWENELPPECFLAMAHHRLGHTAARQYLDKARNWIDESDRDEKTRPTWPQRVELQTLRREAEGLIKQGKRP